MNPAELFELASQGIKLFSHIHSAVQHHNSSFVNMDNLTIAGDVAAISSKLYTKSKANHKTKAAPSLSCCAWDGEGAVFLLSYNKQTGSVGLHWSRSSGNGQNDYFGSGQIYSDSMDAFVVGYNSEGTRLLIRFVSNNGLKATVIINNGEETSYIVAVRTSNWYFG